VLVDRCRALADAWERLGHGPAVPAYASVVLRFDPLRLDRSDAERAVTDALASAAPTAPAAARTVEIPTRYDGPDLAATAQASGLTTSELVELHSTREYVSFFLGFLPGFAYCGTLDPRIVAPRLERPRERVRAGAVAVADGQTAIYPFDSPGGWRILGSTSLVIFDAAREPAALIHAGDRVRFVPQ
jgi:KipI family sensor histidine kinase inhibitor